MVVVVMMIMMICVEWSQKLFFCLQTPVNLSEESLQYSEHGEFWNQEKQFLVLFNTTIYFIVMIIIELNGNIFKTPERNYKINYFVIL
jgi:hypothetical protein